MVHLGRIVTDEPQNITGTYGTVAAWAVKRDTSGNHDASVRHHDSFHPDPRDITKAGLAIDIALRDGGSTIGRDYVQRHLRDGYTVGGKNPGRSYPLTLGRDELAYELHRYVTSSAFYIVPTFIGLWVHDGRMYFDTVEIVPGIVDALQRGKERGQHSIFCNATCSDIRVSDRAIARAMFRAASQELTDALESDPIDYGRLDAAADAVHAANAAMIAASN